MGEPRQDVAGDADLVAELGEKPSVSQTVKAQLHIRALIVRGMLQPGERVTELHMVQRLGMSRTPVRMALVRLQEEGLLDALPAGGFAVRVFSPGEVFDAIESRGTLEGLAARLAAERGAPAQLLEAASGCLDAIDAAFADGSAEVEIAAYVEHNARFHQLIAALAASPVLSRQLERVSVLPFASPSAFANMQKTSPGITRLLAIAQDQHRCALDAIARREGARAEAIMREHARMSRRNFEDAFSAGQANPAGAEFALAFGQTHRTGPQRIRARRAGAG